MSGEPVVATRAADGTDMQLLGQYGHVTGLTWSSTLPGGPADLSCVLQVPPAAEYAAIGLGRRCEVHYGGTVVWDGKLTQPVPGSEGWQIAAKGIGQAGDSFLSVWTSWNADNPVDQAITRGLRWVKGTFPAGLYLAEQQDSGTQTVTDFLNLITKPGANTWRVDRVGGAWKVSIAALPTQVTRVLVATSPAARSVSAYINALTGRYQSGTSTYALTTATSAAGIAAHGREEGSWDMTAAGVLSSGAATGWVTSALSQYQAASWAGPIDVQPGQYLTTGGVPTDLGCEKAGEVVQLIAADGPYTGQAGPAPPVTFVAGGFEYAAATGTAQITPFLSVPGDLSSLLDALATKMPKPKAT